jgi:hypothetical protein
MVILNKLLIPVPAMWSYIIPLGRLRPLIRSWSRDTAFAFGPLQNLSPSLRLNAVSSVTMLKSTSTSSNCKVNIFKFVTRIHDKLLRLPNQRCGERPNQHDHFEFQSLDINHRPRIVSNVLQVMKEGEFEERKNGQIY